MSTAAIMEIPSHRACAHCRSQKVRCIPDESNPDVCQRCARSGRPCVFTPLQKRKQRKRTDTRVAELEREMRAMRAMLKHKQDGAKTPPREPASTGPAEGLWYERNVQGAARQPAFPAIGGSKEVTDGATPAQSKQQSAPLLWPSRFPDRPPEEGGDVINRGLLSMATARQLLDIYRTDLFPHYPMVPISPSTSADELRSTKPTLFLAIIAAAAGKENSDLSATLDKEVLQAYASRSLVRSEKSLELVQALLISAVWYHPPARFGQLKYYEYIHMAATMAMDIGIGTRPLQHRSRHSITTRGREPASQAMMHPAEDANNPDLSMTPRSRGTSPDTGSTESRRTFLACYAICAGVSLSLRRPNMLRVSSYIRECLEHLEQAPDALRSDRTVVAWVKVTMIAEEISTSFSFDDPGGVASISELRTQLMLKDFSARLTAWYTNTPETDICPSGIIMYYTIRLYLHEIALHVDHSPEDFRAPYQMGTIHVSHENEEIPTQVLAEAIAECISCAHGLLNTFLAMDPNSCRALPVFSYVRVSFAAFVLAKLCLSAAHPRSRIGKVLDRSSLKVESYLDRAVLHVRNVVGAHRTRVPAIFLALLFKLRQWCLNPEMLDQPKSGPGIYDLALADKIKVPEIEGPRVTEHTSSAESSPQGLAAPEYEITRFSASEWAAMTAEEDKTAQFSTPQSGSGSSGQASSGASHASPPAQSQAQSNPNTVLMGGAAGQDLDGGISGPSTTAASISIPQTVSEAYDPQAGELEQMEIDYSFFNSLGGDMDGFPEGGLTGLDDWMPNDLSALQMGQMPVPAGVYGVWPQQQQQTQADMMGSKGVGWT
jgi:hypothetical protein